MLMMLGPMAACAIIGDVRGDVSDDGRHCRSVNLGQQGQPGFALEQYGQGLELPDAVLRGGDQEGPDGGKVDQAVQGPPRSAGRALVDLDGSDLLLAVVGVRFFLSEVGRGAASGGVAVSLP